MDARAKVVGTRIKLIRVGMHLPQNEVARLVGISQAHLSNIESGHSTLTLDKMLKLHDVLGCKLKDFFVDFDAEDGKPDDRYSLQELSTALLMIRGAQTTDEKRR